MTGLKPTLARCRHLIVLAALLTTSPAVAVRVQGVDITGITDADALHNARQSLSLLRSGTANSANVSEERLSFLLRKAPEEIRAALEPYGYYDTTIKPDVQRNGDAISVHLAVQLGEPVHVASSKVAMNGPAHDDAKVTNKVDGFKPQVGQVLDHRLYEASKNGVSRELGEHGYFDANLAQHRVEVTRATHSAAIDIAWDSGPRYAFGATTFGPNQFRPGLLDPLLRWKAGQPYDQAKLLATQQSLVDLDYFGVVDVSPDLEHKADGAVPIAISTTPAKRNVYSAGLSYGTDTGVGVRLGFDRRWVNRRGHKISTQLEWAQKRKIAAAEYRIPAFGWLDGWYALSTSLRDETSDAVRDRIAEVVASRTGLIGGWNLTAAMHVQRESYQDAAFLNLDSYATLVFPSLTVQTSHGDDKLYPTRGWGFNADVRGGTTSIGSSLDFAQVRIKGSFVHSFGLLNRLLLRGEIGHTFTDDFDQLPPSLRFFAGGDNSVRGYGFQEIGPRVNGENVGARNLAVFSAEIEHRYTPTWGAAAFIDAGDAFDTDPHAHVGIGVGLRWRSPVGPVRIDIAHGLNDPVAPIRLHLNIGADL
jgi:translocation and assembly module TamA